MGVTNEFLLGAALSIPLSILANLFTPFVQRRLDRQSRKAALKRRKRDEGDLKRIESYVQKPELYFTSLIEAGLKATLYSAVVGILAGIVYALGQLSYLVGRVNYGESWHLWDDFLYEASPWISSVFGIAIGMIGSLLVIGIIRPVLRDAVRFRNYEDYKNGVVNNKED
jgi:hypothetical protein